jgi:TolA-binding protein
MDSKHRHDLKKDEFANVVLGATDTLAERGKLIAGIVAAVVVLLVIVGGVMAWRTRQANEAGALLGVAMATATSPIVPGPTAPGAAQTPGTFPTEQARAEAALAAFNAVIAEAPGTEAARMAAYYAASELLAVGRYEEAERAFADIAASEGSSLRGQSAKLGQAEALVGLGRTNDALAIYNELAAVRDGILPADAVLIQLGRTSERAGLTAEARAAYQRLVDEFPDSLFVPDAQQQLAALN